MIVVGLTGNFGMGKSTVLAMFMELGSYTISADAVVSRLLEDAEVSEGVKRIFGDEVFDEAGRLLKDRVAGAIFSDSVKRMAIEDLLHPLVFAEIEKEVAGTSRGVVVVEVPLLFERGYERRFAKTVTVLTERGVVLERMGAAGIAPEEVLARHAVQMPIEEKARRSDFVVDNSGSKDETFRQVKEIYARLLQLSPDEKREAADTPCR